MRLHQYVASAKARPFRWGRHDCVTFAGGWIAHRTGSVIVPRYDSLRAARALLEERCPVAELSDRFECVGPLMAAMGDVCEVPAEHEMPAFGIVTGGGYVACFVGRSIGFVAQSGTLRAWRIG